MCGTAVCKVFGSTVMRPRWSVERPAASRFSLSVEPTRPAAKSSISLATVAAVVEPARHAPPLGRLDAGDRRAEPQRHVAVAQIVGELLDQLAIDEVEEGRARLDQRHGDVEGAEDRRIFDADHPGPDDGHAARQARQVDDLVRIEDRRAVERHVIGAERVRAAGDEGELGSVDVRFAVLARHLDAVRPDVAGLAARRLHGVAAELVFEHLDLVVERLVQPGDEVAAPMSCLTL